LSDFYDDEEGTVRELRRAGRMGHEIAVFQILSREELELPYRRDLEIADLETGRRIAVDTATVRRRYLESLTAFLDRVRARTVAEGFHYSLAVTDTPPDRTLRTFLVARPRARG
jgi:hypothetical protein